MKNILLIGGSTGIGYELSKKLVDNNNVFVSSRNTEIFNGTEIKTHELNLDDDFELDWLPDQIDGFVYLPGTINLRPFKGIKPSTFMDDFMIDGTESVASQPTDSSSLSTHRRHASMMHVVQRATPVLSSLCSVVPAAHDRHGASSPWPAARHPTLPGTPPSARPRVTESRASLSA